MNRPDFIPIFIFHVNLFRQKNRKREFTQMKMIFFMKIDKRFAQEKCMFTQT